MGTGGTVKDMTVAASYISGCGGVGGVMGSNSGTVQDCYYLDTTGSNRINGTIVMPTARFKRGEVAYLLQETDPIWGQTIGIDDSPILGGEPVYYGYISCAEAAEKVYTNDDSASKEKPAHSTGTYTDIGSDTHLYLHCLQRKRQ